jgi:serine/threonine-protein phosphatase PGAM5
MKSLLLAVLLVLPAAPRAAEMPKPAPKGVHYVVLIRHGHYDRDTASTDDRRSNGLNAQGRAQAALVARRLAALPVRPRLLVSSDFLRATQTAEIISEELDMKVTVDSLIHECTPTTERADIMKTTTPAEVSLCEHHLEAAWRKYFEPTPNADTHDVLVCHGNVIRWCVAHALGMDPKDWLRMDIGNCSLTVIAVRPDGTTRLVMYSDVGHIPVNEQSWTGAGAGWKVGAAK